MLIGYLGQFQEERSRKRGASAAECGEANHDKNDEKCFQTSPAIETMNDGQWPNGLAFSGRLEEITSIDRKDV